MIYRGKRITSKYNADRANFPQLPSAIDLVLTAIRPYANISRLDLRHISELLQLQELITILYQIPSQLPKLDDLTLLLNFRNWTEWKLKPLPSPPVLQSTDCARLRSLEVSIIYSMNDPFHDLYFPNKKDGVVEAEEFALCIKTFMEAMNICSSLTSTVQSLRFTMSSVAEKLIIRHHPQSFNQDATSCFVCLGWLSLPKLRSVELKGEIILEKLLVPITYDSMENLEHITFSHWTSLYNMEKVRIDSQLDRQT